jgi:hypothetical protein
MLIYCKKNCYYLAMEQKGERAFKVKEYTLDTQESLSASGIAAHNILRASSLYCTQLRALMAPTFCSVSVLTQLQGIKNTFKKALDENVEYLDSELKASIVQLTQEMMDFHAEQLEIMLPKINKSFSSLQEILQKK